MKTKIIILTLLATTLAAFGQWKNSAGANLPYATSLNQSDVFPLTGSLLGTNKNVAASNMLAVITAVRDTSTGYQLPLALVPAIGTNNLPRFHVWRYGAYPDDGVDDTQAIQRAADAASAYGVANNTNSPADLDAGTYDVDPANALWPTLISEGHVNCISLHTNWGGLRGIPGKTRIRAKNSTVLEFNIIGSGWAAYGATNNFGATNVTLSGIIIDANNTIGECTQIYFHKNWMVTDMLAKNTTSGDAYDFQYGTRAVLKNCNAVDISGNFIGLQDTDDLIENCTGVRVATSQSVGALAGALSIVGNNILEHITVLDSGLLINDGSGFTIQNSYLHSTNISATPIGITNGSKIVFKDTVFAAPATSTQPLIYATNAVLDFIGCSYDNNRPFMRATNCTLQLIGNTLGANNNEHILLFNGGSLYAANNYFYSGSANALRNDIATPVLFRVVNNYFRGAVAFYTDYSPTTADIVGNFVEGSANFGSANASIVKDNVVKGTFTFYGPHVISGNDIGTLSVVGGSPIFLANNVIRSGAPNTAPVSISVTASPFTYTNPNVYPIKVYVIGGVVTSVTKNSVGVATAGQIDLPPGGAIVVTYSSAPTMSYSY